MIKTATDLKAVIAAAIRALAAGQADLVAATKASLVDFRAAPAEASEAENIIKYYRELTPTDEAAANFSSVAKFGQVFPVNFAIAVAMAPAYYSRNNTVTVHGYPDRHMGVLNHRDRFFLKLLSYQLEKSAHTYYVADRNGNQACFQTTSPANVAIGDCFVVNATVKRHILSAPNIKLTLFRDIEIIENKGKRQ